MTITLYKNQSLSNVVDKVLTSERVIEGVRLVDETFNEYNPSIIISGVTDFDGYNYFKFDDKYYFIQPDGIEWSTDTICTVKGQLDVLMTYKDVIRSLECYVERSDDEQPYVQDDFDTLACYQKQEIIDFNEGFSEVEPDGVYIFMTAQKGYGN